MNKTALKTFATNARRELLKKVEARAMKIGITEDNIKKADIESSDAIFIDGKQLSKEEKTQRDKLIDRINQIGFKRVMEEVAYTWFNRFTALRFMEVNDYLPTKVRVLSSTNSGSTEPDMMKEALTLDLDLDKEYIYEQKMNNNSEELFKYLIIKHCNDLNRYMPFMFETINDYTEILFPEGLLATDSFVRYMTNIELIPEDNWGKVEVIGWLYQYYISEEKKRIFDVEIKRGKSEIPPATQLFTPEWIVRYMVQNSLGRYWIESHSQHRDLLDNWEFYLENPDTGQDINLDPYINRELKVEDIKCFDPAMGSGHILVYMFDVLYEIYSKCGYMEREIPRLIIENNLYGLDIDDRAYQLACFSVVMKALEHNKRFFRSIEREGLKLHLAAIQETDMLDQSVISYIAGEANGENFSKTEKFINQYRNAKIFGTLIKIEESDTSFFEKRFVEINSKPAENLFEEDNRKRTLDILPQLIKQTKIMSSVYDVLVSNPPYIGRRDMCEELNEFINDNYKASKEDVFSAFIEYSFSKVIENGQIGFMSPFVWMFISSYEELRKVIIDNKSISSLIQLEYSAFSEATVPICTFTLRNSPVQTTGEFIRLTDFPGADEQPRKVIESIVNNNVKYRFRTLTSEFKRIQGSPVAYWVSERTKQIFESSEPLGEIAEPRVGLQTGNNDQFLRLWYEVDINKVGFDLNNSNEAMSYGFKWFPYNKGGDYRKWYGNNEWVVNWENDGFEIKNNFNEKGKLRSRPQNRQYYFREGITWSDVSSSYFGVRYSEKGFIFDVKGSSMFPKESYSIELVLAIIASKVVSEFLKILNPTISFQVGDLKRIPIILPDKTTESRIVELSKENILICKEDWDWFETSWNFKDHPLIAFKNEKNLIRDAYNEWETYKIKQFKQLQQNEMELNEILINLYGLANETTNDVDEKFITLKKPIEIREVKSFISYAIGCLFGRYSLDEQGLIYAGGEFELDRYKSISPVPHNIIPITEESYFDNDMVELFINFLKVSFGEEHFNDNVNYICDILGKKRNESYKETLRRYFLNEFYNDHLNTYKSTNKRNKAPIYVLFTSGKEKAFNCLIYLHRYDKTILSRIRTDYLHDYQIRLDAEKKDLLNIIEGDSTAKEVSNAKKELKVLDKKIDELKAYDELLHHMADMQIELDLDDGVKVNHEKFKGLVAKI
ncbi:BREX-1 system adenine-specific DNA-methyltransferase PglX [Bacillus sp. J33]|uniref:BREX-1 system adenine-specific DNA-methyltransferase PglX n=1 Tax=Bacillus sp. J33 TaxID=935836 RepID=UPI00047A3F95|nr:BREX-1 system adenine-specific DNA-methyltransferase PglX [Bacillus sp. J33]